MIFSRIKLYGIAFAGVAISALLVVMRLLTASNSRLRSRAENAEARVKRARVIAERDNEIEEQTESRRAQVKNEIKDTGSSSAIHNPDSLWDD
jgi:hypothetical protein